ncbi:hypothetical protein [Neptunomonas sp. XY-337]|uniref:hypothetical protein n=1 Tax=Neptunomonas sp. XY-337 TaxID=2561897 RepID=UPI0010AA1B81|nr:hypothetical protein [Neptunomonas sp. XY-337]
MNINTRIRPDCVRQTVKIEKAFIFYVIGKGDSSKKRKLDTYTAISFSTQECDDNLILNLENKHSYTEKNNKVNFSNKTSYFKEIDILRQFWGNKSEPIDKTENIENIKKTRKLLDIDNSADDLQIQSDIISLINYSAIDRIIFVNDEKSNQKFILVPLKGKLTTDGKIQLSVDNWPDISIEKIKKACSFCFWVHTNELLEAQESTDGISIFHKIEFTQKINIPDFKVYYQLPEMNEIKNQHATCYLYDEEELKEEVIQIHSGIKYFRDWIRGGIIDSTLLRFRNTTHLDKQAREGNLKLYSAGITTEDKSIKRKREVNALLLGIAASLILSLGFDATRVETVGYRELFPLSQSLNAEFLWLITSLGLFLKAHTIQRATKAFKAAIVVSLVPIGFWFFWYYFSPTGLTKLNTGVPYIRDFFEVFDVSVHCTYSKILLSVDLLTAIVIGIYFLSQKFKLINWIRER